MNIKSMAKKAWNSKTFETIVDVSTEIAKCISDSLLEVFNDKTEPIERDYYQETYEYWKKLLPCEREYYFSHNEVLQKWGDNYYYDDKEQCAKHIAWIASRENRAFTNKYDRY